MAFEKSKEERNYTLNRKSNVVGYLFWFFLGGFGAHRFYIRDYITGPLILAFTILYITLSVVGVLTINFTLSAVSLIFGAIAGIIVLVDFFYLAFAINKINKKLASNLGLDPSIVKPTPGKVILFALIPVGVIIAIIALIAIVAATVLPNYMETKMKALDSQIQTDLNIIKSDICLFYKTNGDMADISQMTSVEAESTDDGAIYHAKVGGGTCDIVIDYDDEGFIVMYKDYEYGENPYCDMLPDFDGVYDCNE